MYKRKTGEASWNRPDASVKINNSVIHNLKYCWYLILLCICLLVLRMTDVANGFKAGRIVVGALGGHM